MQFAETVQTAVELFHSLGGEKPSKPYVLEYLICKAKCNIKKKSVQCKFLK